MKEEVRKRLRFSDVASETGEKTRKLTGIQQPYEYVPTAAKRTRPLFKVNDYQVSKKLENLMNKVKEAGGNPDQLKDAILNFRLSVDNMSAKLMQGGLPKEVSETLEKQLGTYLNTEYKQFNKLNPLSKWKVTAETKEKAVEMLIKDKQEALLAKGSSPQYIELRSADIEEQARDQVNNLFLLKVLIK
jgi:hypothetical protein